jgi:hypothetical protein
MASLSPRTQPHQGLEHAPGGAAFGTAAMTIIIDQPLPAMRTGLLSFQLSEGAELGGDHIAAFAAHMATVKQKRLENRRLESRSVQARAMPPPLHNGALWPGK